MSSDGPKLTESSFISRNYKVTDTK